MGDFCPSCLAENADGALICALCGGDMNLKNKPHQLPAITILNAKYLIGRAIGEDDSGITYIGVDLSSNQKVTVKEFYPAGMVSHNSVDPLRVKAINADNELNFKRDREKFVAEAVAISRADKDSNTAHVRDAFYENSTSYIVMDYTEISNKAETLPKRSESNSAAKPEEKQQPRKQNAAPQPSEQPKKEPAPTEPKIAEKDMSKDTPKESTPKRKTPIWLIAAAICLCVLAAFVVITKVVLPSNNYNSAVKLMESGKYEEAIAAFEALNGYKDSAEQISACETAITDNKYNAAIALMDEGKYEEAIAEFEALGGYKDSADKIKKCRLHKAQVGDYVSFGSYEQDNDTSNDAEDIEWLVLDKQDNKILVISKYGLDAKPYNKEYVDITWGKCSLRSWLNDDFYNAAFSADEKQCIALTSVPADKNPEYDTDSGNDTTDNVFLLSISEVNKYFSSDSSRQCDVTDYVAYTSSNRICRWWLRSLGNYQNRAALVYYDGSVLCDGSDVDYDSACVRPALWINLDS